MEYFFEVIIMYYLSVGIIIERVYCNICCMYMLLMWGYIVYLYMMM